MKIDFYKCSSDANVLEKVISNKVSVTGSLKNDSSVIKPVILIEGFNTGYNYCYIWEWNRWYFVTGVEVYRTGLYIVSLSVDVLMTYKNDIKKMRGVVSRLTSGSPYGQRDVSVSAKTECEKVMFPSSPFKEDGSYILIAQGGEV